MPSSLSFSVSPAWIVGCNDKSAVLGKLSHFTGIDQYLVLLHAWGIITVPIWTSAMKGRQLFAS